MKKHKRKKLNRLKNGQNRLTRKRKDSGKVKQKYYLPPEVEK